MDGFSLIMRACVAPGFQTSLSPGKLACIELLASRARLDGVQGSQRHRPTILGHAIDANCFEAVPILLAAGATDLPAQPDSNTGLMAAARAGDPALLRLLMPFSDPLALDRARRSALMLAAAADLECVELLLGASDPAAIDRDGLAALDYAQAHNQTRAVAVLEAWLFVQAERGALGEAADLAKPGARAPRL